MDTITALQPGGMWLSPKQKYIVFASEGIFMPLAFRSALYLIVEIAAPEYSFIGVQFFSDYY